MSNTWGNTGCAGQYECVSASRWQKNKQRWQKKTKTSKRKLMQNIVFQKTKTTVRNEQKTTQKNNRNSEKKKEHTSMIIPSLKSNKNAYTTAKETLKTSSYSRQHYRLEEAKHNDVVKQHESMESVLLTRHTHWTWTVVQQRVRRRALRRALSDHISLSATY